MGSDGLGSTSTSLMGGGGGSPGGGGGGGGGGGDFGSITQKLAKPGSTVQKGDMVAEFDRQFMLQRIDDYKAGVLQQELNVTNMVANLEVTRKAHEQSIRIAKGDVDRAELDLRTAPVRSDMEKERFKLALEEAQAKYKQLLEEVPFVRAGEEAQVKISQMDLQQSKIELRRAETNAERMVMKSPMQGLVVMLNIFMGGDMRPVQEGDPVMAGMPFMRIVDPNSMIVNAYVNQVDVEHMRVGHKARIKVDAFPDLELPGHVYSVAAMPRSSGSSARASFLKEIPVAIKIDKMDPRVIPDLSVSVDVIIEEQEAAAIAPLASVFYDSPDSKPYVYVKNATGWEKRPVELGLADNLNVSIKSGLRAGETVAEEKPPIPTGETSASLVLPMDRQLDVWRRPQQKNSVIG
jgi:multidrug resistance efflux pump